jgi:ATP-dependent helicase/nuclease subunit B
MTNIATISPHVPFLDAIADVVLREAAGDPLKLSDTLILLPTRRACLHLREAFQNKIQKATILPRMRPIGDADEEELYFALDADIDLPPAVDPLRRQFLLAEEILRNDPSLSVDQAVLLAEALAKLLDETQTAQRDFSGLGALVEKAEYAEHWQRTVKFLETITEFWPRKLVAEGCMDPAERRNKLLLAQAEVWRAHPPVGRVIAAGSTGSIPATAELLATVAKMPKGLIVLPGLDQDLAEDAWEKIEESHPQYTIKKLLESIGTKRAAVKIIGDYPNSTPRVRLLQESMRPANATDAWRELKPSDIPETACADFQYIACETTQDEAQTIAIIMREALEEAGRRAVLVTPDRALAERVRTELLRWDINVNDSGGTALASSSLGGFLVEILKAAAPTSTIIDKLALLKHPLAACGKATVECRAATRKAEIFFREKREANDWLKHIEALYTPLQTQWNLPLSIDERIKCHTIMAEIFATTDEESGNQRLWKFEEGEAVAEFFDQWRSATRQFPPMNGDDYLALFQNLIRHVTVRLVRGLHPRLSILGPLEARLLHMDTVILGGMNEDVWPAQASIDPWMSRPMKRKFELPLPEQRIGLSAHDFVQFASSPNVIITRARRADGSPTVPSRFILQLETVMRALGYTFSSERKWRMWAHTLDEPASDQIVMSDRPRPCPPVAVRPKKMSVTDIDLWRKNPYAIYAKHILKLRILDLLETELGASDKGTIIHAIAENFIKHCPRDLSPDATDQLRRMGDDVFKNYRSHPEVKAFWWPRFLQLTDWFIANEHSRRAMGIFPIHTEIRGEITIGNFTLHGRADRLDVDTEGNLIIIDYKTGLIPTAKSVKEGGELQLSLLAIIAQQGGFADIATPTISKLEYWALKGSKGDKIISISENLDSIIQNAQRNLENLIKTYTDDSIPYLVIPNPAHAPRYDDYAHLSRWYEWGIEKEGA